MASEFQGPIISKKRGGLGRTENTVEGIAGIVFGGVAVTPVLNVATGIALGEIKKLLTVEDAEAIGLTKDYDTLNTVRVWDHIARFFTYCPGGTLYIMLVAQDTTLSAICDKANPYLHKLLTDEFTNREIRSSGVVLNPDAYTPTYVNGLDTDLILAITKANEMLVDLRLRAIFVDGVVLEGVLDTTTISTIVNLRTQDAEYVSVVIGNDSFPALGADIGSVLGMKAQRKVSECLGSVDIVNKPETAKGGDSYPLTNKSKAYYQTAYLTSGKKYSELTEPEKDQLRIKGYIYAGKYEGFDGYFFNDSHTCTAATEDYAYMEDNSVWNKAAKLVRRALMPIMKGEVLVDTTTGLLSPSVIAFYESLAKNSLSAMVNNSEISGSPTVIIDPNQDVVGTGKITLSIGYVRKGILRVLEGSLGAINPAA